MPLGQAFTVPLCPGLILSGSLILQCRPSKVVPPGQLGLITGGWAGGGGAIGFGGIITLP